jgi:DNA-binding response OmpR family regulator
MSVTPSVTPQLPELSGQIRVLVIEDDFTFAHPILARCTDAGMDTRYAPMGRAGLEAVRDTHPHIILLSDTEPEDLALKVGLYARKLTAAPIIVLTHAHSNPALWRAVSADEKSFLPKTSPAQVILERAAVMMKTAYHANQLMISETPADSAQSVPRGWGKCQVCGYLGPRAKFEVSNPLARHRCCCPACKRSEDVVFSVS